MNLRYVLERKYGLLTVRRGWASILCPFHADHSPSAGINLSNPSYPLGFFTCFSCGAKTPWNGFAEKVGLPLLTKGGIKGLKDAGKVLDFTKYNTPPAYVSDLGPFAYQEPPTDWRGITKETNRKVNAKLVFDVAAESRYMFYPFYLNKRLIGGVKSYAEHRYLYLPKSDMASVLFPHDALFRFIPHPKYLVLTEGVRDSLYLLQRGIPALSILGAKQAWNTYKRDLILALDIPTIVLAFDGDTAGIQASNAVQKDLKTCDINLIVMHTKDWSIREGKKVDPASAPPDFYDTMLTQVRAYGDQANA